MILNPTAHRPDNPPGSLELAVIGNCQIAALIDAQARIVWTCLPRPDGDPILCSLLRGSGGASADGVFAVDLNDLEHSVQRYEQNTAVVETSLFDAHGGSLRVTDFCPRFHRHGRVFRPMTLVRIVTPLAGRPFIRLRFKPCSNYGAGHPERTMGSHHLRYAALPVNYRLTTNASLAALIDERPLVLDTPLVFILGPDETPEYAPVALANNWLDLTRSYWHEWVRTLSVPFDWQDAVIRAAITLKLCTYEDTGAVLAALTTSIPEVAGTSRTWDYRYCWLRDSFFVIQALNRLGATRTMEGYLRYIDQAIVGTAPHELRPLYGIGGERDMAEHIAPALDGYRGMGPVRVGNLASEQVQYDVYGAIILAARQLFFDQRLNRRAGEADLTRLEALGEQAYQCFERPDAGIWEFRGRARVHTFSALMCWAATDRLARIAAHLRLPERAAHWAQRAERIRNAILDRSWNAERRVFAASFDGDHLDASVLLMPELGFLDAADPRFAATLAAVEAELVHGDLVFRYRHADDFGVPANTFTMCSFWYINALAASGRTQDARTLFERLLQRRNAVGLFAEDIDPVSGEQWGNFPQTYSMVGIITSALRLSRSWEEML